MSMQSLLIANRGEIARRIIRGARAMGIRCVAVYVEADSDAPFVREADQAVRLPGGYLDGAAIIAAAQRTGAGAVHPGYGFLSENAGFARAVIEAGLTWVGPAPEIIEQMGDKLAAKRLAQEAGVPTLPGSDDLDAADQVGFPLLVKAAAGGGGKGMRIVEHAADLSEAIAAARREAAAGFGDDRVFLERYVPRARHVEIQILGDSHGNCIHLGERECSIQRRHQKILEESPSPRVDTALREAMGSAALRLARLLDYQSAGTVEFLLDDDSGEFFFLEVNTRLQVEHPVTEAVTGIDLVREQLLIAGGQALSIAQDQINWSGAAVEARLYAEDPGAGFLPATGTLMAFEPAPEPAVRWDSGVEGGSVIGVDFDPMLAKVIAHAPTRAEAAGRLALALERLHLGGVTTNRDFLVAALRTPAFLAGDTTTDFIERVAPAPTVDENSLLEAARAAALWLQGEHRAHSAVQQTLPSGWRNTPMPPQRVTLTRGEQRFDIAYRRRRGGDFQFEDGSRARVLNWQATGLDIDLNGHRFHSRLTRDGDALLIHHPRGDILFGVAPRFPLAQRESADGELNAPMPGNILDLRVAAGDVVAAGQTLLTMEAMKMEHTVTAPVDGRVASVFVSAGDQVANGAPLLVVEADLRESA